MIYMASNKYYLILYSWSTLQNKDSNFSYSWALHNYMKNWPVVMRNIMKKKIWLKLRIHAKFCAKTLDISNYCAISFKTGFVLIQNDAKCCAKPRNCCAIESTILWKPYQGTTEILLTINGHTGLLFHKLSMPPPLGASSLAFNVKTDTSN